MLEPTISMGQEDPELMERWLQGDSAAFEELVRRWQQPVARVLGRLVGRADVVPDLCQEVFLKVHRARPHYRENGNFGGWIYRIALNVARDAGRKSRPRLASLSGDSEDPKKPADERLAEQELARLIRIAIGELPENLREVLVLRHYEDLNFEEIARLTRTPASTLKSRFAVALTRLKQKLEEAGMHPEETTP
jgi:RNA polymerase sigma-70 factor (ECF subfamily)